MRKNKWILILLIILVVMGNYPSNIGYGQKATTLKFKDLEQVMRKNNPTIEVNNNIRSNLFDAIDKVDDPEGNKIKLQNSIDEMNNGLHVLRSAVIGIDALMALDHGITNTSGSGVTSDSSGTSGDDSDTSEDDPEDDSEETDDPPAYPSLENTQKATLGYVKGLYEINIKSLVGNIDSMNQQLKEFDKFPITEMELRKSLLQIDMGNQSIIWGAQNLYLGYANLKRNRDELVQSLEFFDDQITIMTLQEELGMITSLDLHGLSNQREQMVFSLETLDKQMDNLLGEINLMLGDDFDRSLELEDTFEIDEKFISKMDYKKDKKLARNNSYSLRLKNYDYHIQNDTLLWENKNGTSDDYRSAKRNADNASLELSQEQKKSDLVFSKAYEEVESKISELENEKNNLEYEEKLYTIAELKYKLGMISKMEFKDSSAKFDSQNKKLETIEQDLFQKLLQYKSLLKGMDFVQ